MDNFKVIARKLSSGQSALIEAEQAIERAIELYKFIAEKSTRIETVVRAKKAKFQLDRLVTKIKLVDNG